MGVRCVQGCRVKQSLDAEVGDSYAMGVRFDQESIFTKILVEGWVISIYNECKI